MNTTTGDNKNESVNDDKIYHPHLLWVQDDNYVHITIDIECGGQCSFEVGDTLYVKTVSTNSQTYLVKFPLWGTILREECQVQWNQRQIYITLRKAEMIRWKYLTSESEYPKWKNWIKTDWKEWNDNGDSNEEDNLDSGIDFNQSFCIDDEDDLGDLLDTVDLDDTVRNNSEGNDISYDHNDINLSNIDISNIGLETSDTHENIENSSATTELTPEEQDKILTESLEEV